MTALDQYHAFIAKADAAHTRLMAIASNSEKDALDLIEQATGVRYASRLAAPRNATSDAIMKLVKLEAAA